jgi:hypothetical protein
MIIYYILVRGNAVVGRRISFGIFAYLLENGYIMSSILSTLKRIKKLGMSGREVISLTGFFAYLFEANVELKRFLVI